MRRIIKRPRRYFPKLATFWFAECVVLAAISEGCRTEQEIVDRTEHLIQDIESMAMPWMYNEGTVYKTVEELVERGLVKYEEDGFVIIENEKTRQLFKELDKMRGGSK